jgi:hypothetical protein
VAGGRRDGVCCVRVIEKGQVVCAGGDHEDISTVGISTLCPHGLLTQPV